MIIDGDTLDPRSAYKVLIGVILPKAIGSSVGSARSRPTGWRTSRRSPAFGRLLARRYRGLVVFRLPRPEWGRP
jgi:hypothetical protein